jgi:NAD(P)H dehydrogenase (quinone)
LWQKGALQDKAVTSFSGAMNPHGGQESTILALNNVFYHWGAIIVSLGYTDPSVYAAGGNPYGASNTADQDTVSEAVLKAAFHQGVRVATFAEAIRKIRKSG